MTLEKARAIEQAATPGPWKTSMWLARSDWFVCSTYAEGIHINGTDSAVIVGPGDHGGIKGENNADFIAYARTAFPLALDVIEAAKALRAAERDCDLFASADEPAKATIREAADQHRYAETALDAALDAFEAAP